MKAQVGDFIKTDNGPRRVVKADEDNGYELENGHVLAESDFSLEDVLLESEVTR